MIKKIKMMQKIKILTKTSTIMLAKDLQMNWRRLEIA